MTDGLDAELVILGSGTLNPDADRGSACHWVGVGQTGVLLDCGAGAVASLARHIERWSEVSHVAITHFHTDHIGALPSVLWALRNEPQRERALTLLGPVGLKNRLDAMSRAFGAFISEPGFEVHVVELEPQTTWIDETLGAADGPRLSLRTWPTNHTDESIALRIGFGDNFGETVDVGYTGDTGPTAGLGSFFDGCEVIISECSSSDTAPREGHLTPRTVAAMADETRADRPPTLVLTHVYPEFDPHQLALEVTKHGFGGVCVAGHDGLRIPLPVR